MDSVLKTLREEPTTAPIILVSAIKHEVGIKKDFDAFLQKPVDESVFIQGLVKFLKHDTIPIEEATHEEYKTCDLSGLSHTKQQLSIFLGCTCMMAATSFASYSQS